MSPSPSTSNPHGLPDFDEPFISEPDIAAFSAAVNAPDKPDLTPISAHHDWRPIKERTRRRKASRRPRRGKDETREGVVYEILRWPLLVGVFGWILALSLVYVLTRFYISQYEYWFTWRGKRQELRKRLRSAGSFDEWKEAAKELDCYLGSEEWKENPEFAYYDHATVGKVVRELKKLREKAEVDDGERGATPGGTRPVEELKVLLEMCVKNNFGGIESARLYSQSYYGTKNLVQEFVDEVERSLKFLSETDTLTIDEKRTAFKHFSSNYGRTALCLSGGASFAYYHLGVVKALLDQQLLPKVLSGTSGGALVACLICTRTDAELSQLLVPELADKITACHDDFNTWIRRFYRTGARFDAVDWARRCAWFTRGSTTFKEAYERTSRILNVSCIPSDPHSPSMLLNYLTAPDCCIFSAVIASAAVPGILNPVVLMTKTRSGEIKPYSFGNKWKDGSLRTDIPLRSLNLHFNVNFSLVSQVNPHVNIFFFSSRGSVGRPVTHRRGKGWRGGFLGSALEQYLKLDLAKWLKVLRHLELLPRPMSQDWSSVFLQKFDGTITLWPKTQLSDFYYILTDPTRERLGRMLETGQRATFPKVKFLRNRLTIERAIEKGRGESKSRGSELEDSLTAEELARMLGRKTRKPVNTGAHAHANGVRTPQSPRERIGSWFGWGGAGKDDETADLLDGATVVGNNEEERGVRERVFGDVYQEAEDSLEWTAGESADEEEEAVGEEGLEREEVEEVVRDLKERGDDEEERVQDEAQGVEKVQASAPLAE